MEALDTDSNPGRPLLRANQKAWIETTNQVTAVTTKEYFGKDQSLVIVVLVHQKKYFNERRNLLTSHHWGTFFDFFLSCLFVFCFSQTATDLCEEVIGNTPQYIALLKLLDLLICLL